MPPEAAFDSECTLEWGDGIGGRSLVGAAEAGSAISQCNAPVPGTSSLCCGAGGVRDCVDGGCSWRLTCK